MFTPLEEIIGKLSTLSGMQISISGQLLVGECDTAFIAASYDAYKRGERIPLRDHNGIARYLLTTLPVYGGGDVLYNETACVTGTVISTPEGFELIDLSYCEVHRDNVAIVVPVELQDSSKG